MAVAVLAQGLIDALLQAVDGGDTGGNAGAPLVGEHDEFPGSVRFANAADHGADYGPDRRGARHPAGYVGQSVAGSGRQPCQTRVCSCRAASAIEPLIEG